MKIEIDYDGQTARCLITEYFGHPDVFVNLKDADEFSQMFCLAAFQTILDNYNRNKNRNSV